MNTEQMKQKALEVATANGGKLTRSASGRWRGTAPGLQFDSATILELIKEGKLSISARTEGLKDKEGKTLHRNSGFATEVSLA